MKILHIFNELKPSGGEAMMLSAAPYWLPHAEIHILSAADQVGSYAPKLAEAGYIIKHLKFKRNFAFFSEVATLFRKEHYNIIQVHTEQANIFYSILARMTLGNQVNIICTIHHFFKFNGILRLRKIIERMIMKKIVKALLISNSPSGLKNEASRFKSHNQLIQNWYDNTYYLPPTEEERIAARKKLAYRDNQCVFISLGGNWSYKNYNLIVEALALIPENSNISYVQVGVQGDGNPLETLASGLGVSDRLQCMGVVEDPKLFLHAADVYIMPSSEEGFGVAAVEAMACGLPAILSDVPALCDFRANIKNLEYINPTANDIAAAMTKFANLTDENRRKIGISIAEDTKNNYGIEIGAIQYLQTYKSFNC